MLVREDGAMVRRARRVAGAWVALGEYLHKTYHEVASWWHVLLTYQRVWTFAAVQLHVMVVIANAAAARADDALLALPSWRALSTWVGTDAGCRLVLVVCECAVKGLSCRGCRRHARQRGGGRRKGGSYTALEGREVRVRRGWAPRGVHTLLSGAWYLAVLAFLLVDLSGDLPRHPWSKPGAHPLRFNVSLSPLDTEPALAWLALPPTWHTGGFELLALAYTVVRLLGGLGMRRLFRGGLRPG